MEEWPRKNVEGIIYLVHFKVPYKHALHYLGWTRELLQRFEHHTAGTGARLMGAVAVAGTPFKIVRTWTGTRDEERRLHSIKNNSKYCPVCCGRVSYDNCKNLMPDSI